MVNGVIAYRGVVNVMFDDWRGVASLLLRHVVSNAWLVSALHELQMRLCVNYIAITDTQKIVH